MAFSVFMLVFYITIAFGMNHNVCRFDKSQYNPELTPPKDPSKLPNVTTTLSLSYMGGVALHLLLFINNIWFEPYFRYYKVNYDTKVDFMQSVDPRKEREQAEAYVKKFRTTGILIDALLRVLILGQAAFQFAFLETFAMKHCYVNTNILQVEASFTMLLSLIDFA